jgi:hypothetical protein
MFLYFQSDSFGFQKNSLPVSGNYTYPNPIFFLKFTGASLKRGMIHAILRG